VCKQNFNRRLNWVKVCNYKYLTSSYFCQDETVHTWSQSLRQNEDSDSRPSPGLWELQLWLHTHVTIFTTDRLTDRLTQRQTGVIMLSNAANVTELLGKMSVFIWWMSDSVVMSFYSIILTEDRRLCWCRYSRLSNTVWCRVVQSDHCCLTQRTGYVRMLTVDSALSEFHTTVYTAVSVFTASVHQPGFDLSWQ